MRQEGTSWCRCARTASLFVGSGSTTTAIDLATAEVAGTLPSGNLPVDGYASTYVNVTGDTMSGNLTFTKADPSILLVKVPFEMTRVLAGKGLLTPLDSVVPPLQLEQDLAEYHPLAMGMGYVDGKPYYVPRKLETRVLFYLKSKVNDAVANWKKFEKAVLRNLCVNSEPDMQATLTKNTAEPGCCSRVDLEIFL